MDYAYPWGACPAWCEYAPSAVPFPAGAKLRQIKESLPISSLAVFEVEAARDRSDSEATSQPIAHDAARQYARRLVQTLVDKKPDRYLLSASPAGRRVVGRVPV